MAETPHTAAWHIEQAAQRMAASVPETTFADSLAAIAHAQIAQAIVLAADLDPTASFDRAFKDAVDSVQVPALGLVPYTDQPRRRDDGRHS